MSGPSSRILTKNVSISLLFRTGVRIFAQRQFPCIHQSSGGDNNKTKQNEKKKKRRQKKRSARRGLWLIDAVRCIAKKWRLGGQIRVYRLFYNLGKAERTNTTLPIRYLSVAAAAAVLFNYYYVTMRPR